MGKHLSAYIERWKRNFNTIFGMRWEILPENEKTEDRLREIVQQIPSAIIPLKLSDKQLIPENLVAIKNEYDSILRAVEKWKKLKGKHNVRARRLLDILPGIDWREAWNWKEEKASTIAYKYIASKYGLCSADTAKKLISLVKQPLKLLRRLLQDIAREAGVKNLSSYLNKPKI
jgi:hypothetical protein